MTQRRDRTQNWVHQWCGQHVVLRVHVLPWLPRWAETQCTSITAGHSPGLAGLQVTLKFFPSIMTAIRDPWSICNKYSKILSPGSRLTFLKVILNPICVISLDLLKLFAFALQPTQRILSCEEKKKKDEMVLFCQLSTLAEACNLFCSTLLLQPDWFLKSYLQNSLAFQNSFLVLIFHRTLLFTHLSFLWISKALCLLLHNSWCGVFVPCFPILLSGFFFKSLLSSI